MNYDLMAIDIMELINAKGINHPILIGHSMGGKVALMFDKKYPNFLKKLVVADIGLKSYPMHHDQILKGLNSINLNTINSRLEAQKTLKKHQGNRSSTISFKKFILARKRTTRMENEFKSYRKKYF